MGLESGSFRLDMRSRVLSSIGAAALALNTLTAPAIAAPSDVGSLPSDFGDQSEHQTASLVYKPRSHGDPECMDNGNATIGTTPYLDPQGIICVGAHMQRTDVQYQVITNPDGSLMPIPPKNDIFPQTPSNQTE